jgi:hypothetical protein
VKIGFTDKTINFLVMKKILFYFTVVSFVLSACNPTNTVTEEEKRTYNLFRAGFEPVYGTVVFNDIEPGKVGVTIQLENTDERYDFPAHLHFGAITEVGELAFRLSDVDGATGTSYTELNQVSLSSGEVFTFDMLDNFNGSVKIHLADGLFSNVVLSYGNIGANENYLSDGMSICTGH